MYWKKCYLGIDIVHVGSRGSVAKRHKIFLRFLLVLRLQRCCNISSTPYGPRGYIEYSKLPILEPCKNAEKTDDLVTLLSCFKKQASVSRAHRGNSNKESPPAMLLLLSLLLRKKARPDLTMLRIAPWSGVQAFGFHPGLICFAHSPGATNSV